MTATIVGLLQVSILIAIVVVIYFTRPVFPIASASTNRQLMKPLHMRSRFTNNKYIQFAFVSTRITSTNTYPLLSHHSIQHNRFLQMNHDYNTQTIDITSRTMTSNVRDRCNSIDSDSTDDSTKRIQLPILKYGYRTEPFTWDELVHILTIEYDLAKLSRSIEQQKEYEVYKRDLLLEWKSVTDNLLCSKFGSLFEKRIDPVTNLAFSYPSVNDVNVVAKILVKNDFPYYIENNIEHWILWKLCEPCTDQDIEEAKHQLTNERSFSDVLHWINPIHLKSIPQIDHVHILGKTAALRS
jgi:Protein of unknown function (DUF3605)